MKKFKRNIFRIILIFLLIVLLFIINYFLKNYKKTEEEEDDKLSVIINMKHLTKDKHLLYYEVMKKLNSTRNFYFIKNVGRPLNENLSELVDNSTVKIVQSNFPDSIFLPLVVSLYGNNIPEFVLFIEGDDIFENGIDKLKQWYNLAYMQIIGNNYDYIFGNSQIINGKKIGCSLLLSKASIIQHLLYYTDADTTHMNPFIQLSFALETKFNFLPFTHAKTSELDNINNKFSLNMNCPSINDDPMPSLCYMLPTFKRNYFSESLPAYSRQTYKPKFYVIIQNDNKLHFNLTYIQSLLNEPIYHIWMQNWNSFFFLNHRLSSVFPCDFIMKFDDDQWPTDKTLIEQLINDLKNKNDMIGRRGSRVPTEMCGYRPKVYKRKVHLTMDHIAVPFLIRTGYFKLDARNKIYRTYHSEDIALSLNSGKLCNVTSKMKFMSLKERQNDKKNHGADKQFISIFKNSKDKVDPYVGTYCYIIRSGYMPTRWDGFDTMNEEGIMILHHWLKN